MIRYLFLFASVSSILSHTHISHISICYLWSFVWLRSHKPDSRSYMHLHLCGCVCISAFVCVHVTHTHTHTLRGEVVMLSDKDKQHWGLLPPTGGVKRRRRGGLCQPLSPFLLLSPCHFFNYPSLLCVPIDPEAGAASFRARARLDSDYSLLSSRHSLPSLAHLDTCCGFTYLSQHEVENCRSTFISLWSSRRGCCAEGTVILL